MPTPVIFKHGNADPFAEVPDDDRNTSLDVLYATNRKLSGKENPEEYFSHRRAWRLRLGNATVQLGEEDTTWSELRKLSLLPAREQRVPLDLVGVEVYGALGTTLPPEELNLEPQIVRENSDDATERFAKEINERLADYATSGVVYVVVHGFNTPFDRNLELVAGFWRYLGRDGVFVSFAWPSKGAMAGYDEDKASARYATRHFRLLLESLAGHTAAERINVLAHSAGSPIVVDALKELSLIHSADDTAALREKMRIGRVILAAPDMDLGRFVNATLDGWDRVPEEITIYVSSADTALGIASKLLESKRLGKELLLEPRERDVILRRRRMYAVDVSRAQGFFPEITGHGYYVRNPWVSADIILTLKFGLHPAQRGLIREENAAHWIFPENYPDVVRPIARQCYSADSK
jgi:esterase/lipase superfamily enzyme